MKRKEKERENTQPNIQETNRQERDEFRREIVDGNIIFHVNDAVLFIAHNVFFFSLFSQKAQPTLLSFLFYFCHAVKCFLSNLDLFLWLEWVKRCLRIIRWI